MWDWIIFGIPRGFLEGFVCFVRLLDFFLLTLVFFCSPSNQIHSGILGNTSLTSLAIHSLNIDERCNHSKLCEAISTHPNLRSVELRNVFVVNLSDMAKVRACVCALLLESMFCPNSW